MKYTLAPELFEKFPNFVEGILVVKNLNNSVEISEIQTRLTEQETTARENFQRDQLSQDPRIAAWRAAYSSFGAKPKKYKCSIEALLRRVLDGESLPQINPLVDLYNALSLKHVLPMGGDDLDNVDGDITLVFSDGTETFQAINSEETKNPQLGEVVYKDSKDVLCRRWNWRECDKTKLTTETTNAVLYVEALHEDARPGMEAACEELKERIETLLNGEVSVHYLDKENTECEF